MNDLHAGEPVETPLHAVGRRSVSIEAGHRLLACEVWYPAEPSDAPATRYDLLPGVSFRGAHAQHDAPVAPGIWPVVLFSHGRTGQRSAYTLLCEALAARGAVVVAADHAGDTLADWLLGTFVDDATNETNRVADIAGLIDAVHGQIDGLPADVLAVIDGDAVIGVGHSYGAHGLFAAAAGRRGTDPERRLRAVVALQGFTRQLSDSALERVDVPTLLVVSADDRTTPPATDADRPWDLIAGRPLWRVDLERAAHQASSDIGLYAALADQVELPDIVRQYLAATTTDAVGGALRPYRELLAAQLEVIAAFCGALGVPGWAAADIDPDVRVR